MLLAGGWLMVVSEQGVDRVRIVKLCCGDQVTNPPVTYVDGKLFRFLQVVLVVLMAVLVVLVVVLDG